MMENCDRLFAKNYLGLKKVDSSIWYGRKVFNNSRRVGAKQQLVLISEVLMNAYVEKGRLDSAFYFQRLHYAAKDSLFNKENQRKFGKVFAELETIEKQYEIESLQREQELQTVKRRSLQFVIIGVVVAAVMVIASLVLLMRYRQKKQQLANAELHYQLEQKQRDLHQQALRMIHINNRLSEIEENLKKMKEDSPNSQVDLKQVMGSIHMSKALEKEWENFNEYFSNVHKGFIERIEKRFPMLSISERRLIVLVRMDLTNKEVASILNIEVGSVKMAKYRLKKRLGLPDEQDLTAYLKDLESSTLEV
jgi:DNA-binding CsgD family transcriptional regulator